MSPLTLEEMRRGFAARPVVAAGDECPVAADFFAAVQGELPPARVAELADHALRCPACAEAWRIAVDAFPTRNAASSPNAVLGATVRRSFTPQWIGLAAAAVVVLAVGVVWQQSPGFGIAREPVYRDDAAAAAVRLEQDATLPRDRFVLRWHAPADLSGVRYTVRLLRADLAPLHVVEALAETRYAVPVDKLADVADGETVIWQVEARGDDGRVRTSATAEVRVGAVSAATSGQ